MSIVTLTRDNVEAEVELSQVPVVIDFVAPWCGFCHQMDPSFEALSIELDGSYKFCKVNVDQARDLAMKYNVSAVPTFVLVKDNKIVGREVGYMSHELIKSKIEEACR
jgi:thioredoxin 1